MTQSLSGQCWCSVERWSGESGNRGGEKSGRLDEKTRDAIDGEHKVTQSERIHKAEDGIIHMSIESF